MDGRRFGCVMDEWIDQQQLGPDLGTVCSTPGMIDPDIGIWN